jgi:hypothetical protein
MNKSVGRDAQKISSACKRDVHWIHGGGEENWPRLEAGFFVIVGRARAPESARRSNNFENESFQAFRITLARSGNLGRIVGSASTSFVIGLARA